MPGAASSRPEVAPAQPHDLAALSDLCLRSKAHWGYDDAFLDACREELSLGVRDLDLSTVGVIRGASGPLTVAQISVNGQAAQLDKLFVDPAAMGRGLGRALFDWAVQIARTSDTTHLRIEADPDARPFYERMGATVTGAAPSGSIPGRTLPVLTLELT